MLEAAFWGLVGSSALIVGAEVSFRFSLGDMVVGLVMAFGVGTLVSSIAFELVEPAMAAGADRVWLVVIPLLLGAVTFFLGDRSLERFTSHRRRRASRAAAEPDGPGTGIALGAALDGIPESAVLGISLVSGGGVSVALLAAIWISNFPEALGSSVDMLQAGRSRHWIRALWAGIVVVSSVAAAVGFALVSASSTATGAAIQAFAAGALLTMIADAMAPEAFGRSALYTGLATSAGFALALLWTTLE